MRFCCSILCLLFCVTTSHSAHSQTVTSQAPSLFQQQAQMAVAGGKTFRVVNLTATAEWIAGSDRESGTAQLQANADGSTNVQLALGKASRTEVQTKASFARTCEWLDQASKSHGVKGPNCLLSIPWFAPTLLIQPSFQMPFLLRTTDEGSVSRGDSAFHEISYLFDLNASDTTAAASPPGQSTVKVLYDPKTMLPAILEYVVHPDANDAQNLDVKILFSNYQSVAGVMMPYHIEKYLQRTLQLKLDVTNASVE
jgi:hypothetical protein